MTLLELPFEVNQFSLSGQLLRQTLLLGNQNNKHTLTQRSLSLRRGGEGEGSKLLLISE